MLNLAREHAIGRSQFDRPIGSFQAVRHKLAESLVAVEGADAALDGGWADPTPFAAAMAKAIAGNAAETVAKHAQQVLAGMGFTSEHPFHHYLKRTMVLDQLLGASASLRNEIGQAALDAGEAPPLLPL
jgi:alkylation response protein AidB-like acyl-CoA dehydrogenase